MKKIILGLLGIALSIVNTCLADVVQVFFAGGQSNANVPWAQGIQSRLTEEYGDTAIVLHVNKNGSPLREWYTGYEYNGVIGRQSLYLQHFYNEAPETPGAWQAGVDDLISQGHDVIISGLFWFQGESDYNIVESWRDGYYKSDFLSMRSALCDDFETISIPSAIALVYHAIVSPLQAIRDQQTELGAENNDIIAFDTISYDRYDGVHITDAQQAGYDMANAFIAIPEPSSVALICCTIGIFLLRRCKTSKDVTPVIKLSIHTDYLDVEQFSQPLKTIYTQSWEFEGWQEI